MQTWSLPGEEEDFVFVAMQTIEAVRILHTSQASECMFFRRIKKQELNGWNLFENIEQILLRRASILRFALLTLRKAATSERQNCTKKQLKIRRLTESWFVDLCRQRLGNNHSSTRKAWSRRWWAWEETGRLFCWPKFLNIFQIRFKR